MGRESIFKAEPGEAAQAEPRASEPAGGERLFIVETVVSHRMSYAVRAGSAAEAAERALAGALGEFDQACLGEALFSARESSEDEFVASFELPEDRAAKLALIEDVDAK